MLKSFLHISKCLNCHYKIRKKILKTLENTAIILVEKITVQSPTLVVWSVVAVG